MLSIQKMQIFPNISLKFQIFPQNTVTLSLKIEKQKSKIHSDNFKTIVSSLNPILNARTWRTQHCHIAKGNSKFEYTAYTHRIYSHISVSGGSVEYGRRRLSDTNTTLAHPLKSTLTALPYARALRFSNAHGKTPSFRTRAVGKSVRVF